MSCGENFFKTKTVLEGYYFCSRYMLKASGKDDFNFKKEKIQIFFEVFSFLKSQPEFCQKPLIFADVHQGTIKNKRLIKCVRRMPRDG